MPSYGRHAKVGALWGFLGKGINEVVAIPTSMVLARLLTPHDFGVAATGWFFSQIANRLTNFGMNTALVQLKEVDATLTSSVFYLNVGAGAVVWAVLTLGADWLGSLYHSVEAAQALPVVALTFLINPLGSVSLALMLRDGRYQALIWLEWLGTFSTAGASVVLAWLGFGYWSLIYGYVLGGAVATIGRVGAAGWRPRLTFSMASLNQVLSFGVGLHTKRLLDSVAQNVDNLVVGRMLGVTALGFYDKSFTMMNRAVMMLSSAGPMVSFQVLSRLQGDDERFRLAYRKLLVLTTFIAYPAFAFLVVVAPELFLFMFGEQWTPAVWPFRILCIAGALKFVTGYVSSATQARGRAWGEVWRQLAYVFAIVVAAAVGSRFGLVGVSLGVLVATVVMTYSMHDFLQKTTSVAWGDIIETQVPALVCAAGLTLSLLLVRAAIAALQPTGIHPIVFMSVSGLVATVFEVAFVRWHSFVELRAVLLETVLDFVPQLAWIVGKAPVRQATGSSRA